MKTAMPNWRTVSGVAAVMAVFFFAQHLDGQESARADSAAATDAQHAAADVRQQQRVERASQLAEVVP